MAALDSPPLTGQSPRKTPEIHVGFLTAFLFAVAMWKGLRMPSTWAATHMTFNYSEGFIRRGLFGQVLRLFGVNRIYHYNFLFLCAAILFVLAGVALFFVLRRLLAGDRDDRGLQAAVLVLASSPAVVFLIHEIGYLDYVGLAAVPFFILWASRSHRLFTIFYVAVPINIILALVHESSILMFAPTMVFTMICHIVRRGSALPRRARILLVVHAILATVLALLASSIAGTLGTTSPEQLAALQQGIASHANFPLRGDAFDAVGRSVFKNLGVLLGHWPQPVHRNYLITTIIVTLPGLAFLGTYGVRLLGRLGIGKRARLVLTVAFLVATLSPLLLHFIGWDGARWHAIALLSCFFCVASLRLFFLAPTDERPHRVDDRLTLTWAAVAMVTGLCTSYYGYLFDGYVVEWFPFAGQLDQAIDLVKGGFHTIP